MIVLRCTSKLLAKLGINPPAELAPSSGELGDWYATLLHTRRGQFVLSMSGVTLLPNVVAGRDLRSFPARIASTLAAVLACYGVPADAIERECAAMSELHYARTDDCGTVGVLTEMQRLLYWDLDDIPVATLTERSLRLAQTPIVSRSVFPDQETCRLFGVSSRRHRETDPGGAAS